MIIKNPYNELFKKVLYNLEIVKPFLRALFIIGLYFLLKSQNILTSAMQTLLIFIFIVNIMVLYLVINHKNYIQLRLLSYFSLSICLFLFSILVISTGGVDSEFYLAFMFYIALISFFQLGYTTLEQVLSCLAIIFLYNGIVFSMGIGDQITPLIIRNFFFAFLTLVTAISGRVLSLQQKQLSSLNNDLNLVNKELKHEITERTQVETNLQQSNETLNNILSTSPIGIGLAEDRSVKWANKGMSKLFNFNNDEQYKNKDFTIFFPTKEEYERVEKIISAELQAGREAETDATLKRKDGSTFTAHLKISSPNPADPMRRAIFTISDVSWRKQAETQQMQKNRLEGVIEMAGAVCHELNQPMMAVLGYSEIILMDVSKDDPIYINLVKIKKQVTRMGEITKKLMMTTKYETRDYIGGQKIIDINKSSTK